MIIPNFTHKYRINELLRQLGDDTCGSVSICSIYEYFKIEHDPYEIFKISKDGKKTKDYPEDGASIIGIALASSLSEKIKVDVYSSYGNSIYDIEKKLGEYEKPLAGEIKKKSNIDFHPSLTLDELINKIDNSSIPILQFCRNGDENNGHSSPLIGVNIDIFLLFPVWDADGEINVNKEEFESKWWLEKSCVFLSLNDL